MFLDGVPPMPLGSVADQLRLTVWYRREQRQIFETLISLYSAVISINPDVSKRVEGLVSDYIECIVPGAAELTKKEAASSIKKQGEALASIFDTLKNYNAKQMIQKKI
jgi:hypothetical protein